MRIVVNCWSPNEISLNIIAPPDRTQEVAATHIQSTECIHQAHSLKFVELGNRQLSRESSHIAVAGKGGGRMAIAR